MCKTEAPDDMDPTLEDYTEIITFDPDGDLYLHVGTDVEPLTKTYLVCSKALSRASRVFKKMLYGCFAESRPSDGKYAWTVDLPEDRQEALELMLHIIHVNFDLVPEHLQITQLYEFLITADKYDTFAIAKPWAHR
ncbi:hypothetical protein CSUB01_10311 [Colletotrichum sublineola]|uniref:BTB domain-containing protein n=1 Tax=Colletotrichum sublineola TaxID=1173701 RepID=A0A066X1S4_COLSU|nr:hypothetical protein CSUB01_10311 [Colletotrichum sublineola]